MRNFNRDGGGRGGSKFGGRDSRNRGFGDRDSGRPMMHKAVCDQCGNECEVPFRPTSGKPVYCNDCFGKSKSAGSGRPVRRDFGDRGFGSRDSGRPMMHQAVCDQCGNPCEVPFRPTPGKPIYCNNCFGKGDNARGKNTGGNKADQCKGQFEALNAKLDKIIKLLTPVAATAPVQAVKEIKKDTKEIKVPELKEQIKKLAKEKKVDKKKPVAKKDKANKKK